MKKKLHFNVDAYTARLIGRENVSNLEGAILELVKNTYDADASKCILYYDGSNNVLYIMDNGCGMDEEVIQKHWMTIGNSSKHTNFITAKGRTQTGAKGIGRFALDRVSDSCTMYTKNINENSTIEWKVNWGDFERAENLTDITAEINYLQNKRVYSEIIISNNDVREMLNTYFKNTGTIFKITNLREEWNHDLIENIRKGLSSLIPPDIENEFTIYLFENNQELEEALIISQHIDNYDYKIELNVNKNEQVEIVLHRNEFDFGNDIDKILEEAKFSLEEKAYFQGKRIIINKTIPELLNTEVEDLGEFHGTLYFNKNSTTNEDIKKYHYKDIKGRKNYSKIFGGIKLYRDNFRVRPYGEKETGSYDWLGLGQRAHGAPGIGEISNRPWRVATEQILGIVHISRTNKYIQDQANREGIVDSKQFRMFQEAIKEIISEFEADRQKVIRKFALIAKEKDKAKEKEREIADIAEKEKKQQEKGTEENKDEYNISAIDAQIVIEDKKKIIQELTDENRLLMNLATSGIIANQCIHETKASIDDVGIDIAAANTLLEDEEIEKAIEYLQSAKKDLKVLKSWFDVTIGSTRRDKREMKYIDLNSLMIELVKRWKKVLKENVKIIMTVEEDVNNVKCFPYEIESIFNNLITNSIYAFKPDTIKEIYIKIKNINDGIEIEYYDTGKGLAVGYKNNPNKILEALETDKRNLLGEKIGTGMGMWIVNKIVKEYNGGIDLSENKKERVGFYIKIKLNLQKKEE